MCVFAGARDRSRACMHEISNRSRKNTIVGGIRRDQIWASIQMLSERHCWWREVADVAVQLNGLLLNIVVLEPALMRDVVFRKQYDLYTKSPPSM